MSNLIEHNAYRILGLDVNVNQKDIFKRYKEIINRLKINDFPKYDLDIGLTNKSRNEDSVNDAIKSLQNQKNNLKEYFFWFSISNTVDEKVLKYLQNNDIVKAIQTWKNASDSNNSTAYFYRKNLAVLYCLLLLREQNLAYLKESLKLWYEIVNSDKFWQVFVRMYEVNNEQQSSTELILEFKKNVIKLISDIYTELYQRHQNHKYVKDFQEIFSVHGDKTEKELLKPINKSIYDDIEKLQKIKIIEDEEPSDKVVTSINEIVKSILGQIEQLHKLGMFDSTESKVVRDHAAESIRIVAVMLHNYAKLFEESSKLLKISIEICGTDSLKEDLKKQLKNIKSNPETQCWFCKSLLSGKQDRECGFYEPWHKIINTEYNLVRFQKFDLVIPRCHSCKKVHERRENVLIGRILGCVMVSVIFFIILPSLQYFWLFVIILFTLNYSFLISFDIGGLKKNPEVKPKKYRYEYTTRQELLNAGWTLGEFEAMKR